MRILTLTQRYQHWHSTRPDVRDHRRDRQKLHVRPFAELRVLLDVERGHHLFFVGIIDSSGNEKNLGQQQKTCQRKPNEALASQEGCEQEARRKHGLEEQGSFRRSW